MLLAFLDQNRAVMFWKMEGAADEIARQAPFASDTSLIGLLRHLTVVERSWFEEIFVGDEVDYGFDFDADEAALYLDPNLNIAEGLNVPAATYVHTSSNWSSSWKNGKRGLDHGGRFEQQQTAMALFMPFEASFANVRTQCCQNRVAVSFAITMMLNGAFFRRNFLFFLLEKKKKRKKKKKKKKTSSKKDFFF